MAESAQNCQWSGRIFQGSQRNAPLTETSTKRKTPDHGPSRWQARAAGVLRAPFALIATILKRSAQILLSLFILFLHPQLKWLVRVLAESRLVRIYLRPAMRSFVANVYDPYFAFLSRLPPFWATVSIAVPLAALEPAKLYATILIAQQPSSGVLLWLLLQALGLVLIDRTWTAVRPQSRKIRLVSRLHAWGWLNYSYGKYWVQSSPFYQAVLRWQAEIRRGARAWWSRFVTRWRQRSG